MTARFTFDADGHDVPWSAQRTAHAIFRNGGPTQAQRDEAAEYVRRNGLQPAIDRALALIERGSRGLPPTYGEM